ncbi:MAG: shikimate dehydrogenase [Pseudomonadota bacterium]
MTGAVKTPRTAPRLAGVVGAPIGHSLSPLIHTIWAAREGVNGYYVPVEIADDDEIFRQSIASLQTVGFAGVNVTLPHKERALKLATTASARAKRACAANMLTFSPEGVHADNSDIEGFRAALAEYAAPDEKRDLALILGAGGASRGVAIAIEEAGYKKIIVANRTKARADDLAGLINGAAAGDWEDRNDLAAGADLVVNTTSLGMTGKGVLDFDIAAMAPGAIVADIVYTPLKTPLLVAAKESGRRAVGGLSMLMHQAAPGYRAWLGNEAVVDEDLQNHLLRALARKDQA